MSRWNSANTPKPSGLSQTPIPLPQLPGVTYRASVPSTTHSPVASKPGQNAPTTGSRTSKRAIPRSAPTQSQSSSQPQVSSRVSVVLRSPTTPHEYDDADELANDELVMSDLTPQFSKKVTQQVQQASALSREARQTRTPTSKATTPIPPRSSRTTAAATTTTTATPSRRTRTPTQPSSAADSPKPKRLGRPKGWKPGMSYADVRKFGPEVAAANAHLNPTKSAEKPAAPRRPGRPRAAAAQQPNYYSGPPKRRGRPPKPPSPTPWAIYDKLQPTYVQFHCEWEHCQAELHNLETLRKHVRIVHCGGALPATCFWGDCAVKAHPPKFATRDALLGHVEARHVTPFAWHVGDGPKISTPDISTGMGKGKGKEATMTSPADGDEEQLPDFLFDEEGNQVTPSVRDQQIEDLATWNERRKQLKALLRRINDALPDEEESGASDDEAMHNAPLVAGTSGF